VRLARQGSLVVRHGHGAAVRAGPPGRVTEAGDDRRGRAATAAASRELGMLEQKGLRVGRQVVTHLEVAVRIGV